jgi:nitroreductase
VSIKLEIYSYNFVAAKVLKRTITMEALDAILTRRSIRRYSDKKITDETVNKILEAGMYAPSAVNKQPWHFIVFSEKQKCIAITEIHKSASMLMEAQMAILICYDEKLQHDEGYGVIDCSAATENMLLAAHALGLGACWVGICPRKNRMDGLKNIFGMPENIIPFAIISLGYPAETRTTLKRFNIGRVHKEKW